MGASGDLAPLSHMVAAMMGHGRASLKGAVKDAAEALEDAGLAPLELEAKEGLALINGTEIMKASGVVSVLRASNASRAADAIAALSIEALKGSVRPFQDLLAQLKNNEGQRRTAANVRACLAHSEVLASHEDCDRVQDPYSLRCVPQIHGAVKTALAHVTDVLSAELNAVTDNPLVVPKTGEVFSAGLFHGQPLSMILDYLGLSLCTLANVSERRVEQLVNPDLSRLPAFLTPRPGLHSGLMIAQYAAAAIASENKVHAHPASVDTIPTSANQEDHVSMGITAARKARTILDNVEAGLGIELVCGAQAREFTKDLRADRGDEAPTPSSARWSSPSRATATWSPTCDAKAWTHPAPRRRGRGRCRTAAALSAPERRAQPAATASRRNPSVASSKQTKRTRSTDVVASRTVSTATPPGRRDSRRCRSRSWKATLRALFSSASRRASRARRQELRLAPASALPDGSDGVDDPAGGEVEAWRGLRLARLAAAVQSTGVDQLGAGGPVDRAVDAATAQEGRVGRVDDRVDRLLGDVAANDLEHRLIGQPRLVEQISQAREQGCRVLFTQPGPALPRPRSSRPRSSS